MIFSLTKYLLCRFNSTNRTHSVYFAKVHCFYKNCKYITYGIIENIGTNQWKQKRSAKGRPHKFLLERSMKTAVNKCAMVSAKIQRCSRKNKSDYILLISKPELFTIISLTSAYGIFPKATFKSLCISFVLFTDTFSNKYLNTKYIPDNFVLSSHK